MNYLECFHARILHHLFSSLSLAKTLLLTLENIQVKQLLQPQEPDAITTPPSFYSLSFKNHLFAIFPSLKNIFNLLFTLFF